MPEQQPTTRRSVPGQAGDREAVMKPAPARIAAILATGLLLAGCASAPRGLLQTVAPIPNTDKLDMLTATTRAVSD